MKNLKDANENENQKVQTTEEVEEEVISKIQAEAETDKWRQIALDNQDKVRLLELEIEKLRLAFLEGEGSPHKEDEGTPPNKEKEIFQGIMKEQRNLKEANKEANLIRTMKNEDETHSERNFIEFPSLDNVGSPKEENKSRTPRQVLSSSRKQLLLKSTQMLRLNETIGENILDDKKFFKGSLPEKEKYEIKPFFLIRLVKKIEEYFDEYSESSLKLALEKSLGQSDYSFYSKGSTDLMIIVKNLTDEISSHRSLEEIEQNLKRVKLDLSRSWPRQVYDFLTKVKTFNLLCENGKSRTLPWRKDSFESHLINNLSPFGEARTLLKNRILDLEERNENYFYEDLSRYHKLVEAVDNVHKPNKVNIPVQRRTTNSKMEVVKIEAEGECMDWKGNYGFINSPEGNDIFCHVSQTPRGQGLKSKDLLTFKLVRVDGKLRANEVRIKNSREINLLADPETKPLNFKRISLNGKEVEALVDGGANFTACAESFYKDNEDLFDVVEILEEEADTAVEQIKTIGRVNAVIEIGDEARIVPMTIIRNLRHAIVLGKNVLHNYLEDHDTGELIIKNKSEGCKNRVSKEIMTMGKQLGKVAADELLKRLSKIDLSKNEEEVRELKRKISEEMITLNQFFLMHPDLFGEDFRAGRVPCSPKKFEVIGPVEKIPCYREKHIPINQEKKRILEDWINEMLQNDVISKETSAFVTNIFAVPKPDIIKTDGTKKKDYRIVVAYNFINKYLRNANYNLPTIETIKTKIQGAQYFSLIDIRHGFYNIKLEEKTKQLTGFQGPRGEVYVFNVLPMGAKPSPGIFQKSMCDLFQDINQEEIIIYVDDILIIGRGSKESHLKTVNRVLKKMEENFLRVKPSKIFVAKKKLKYLGYELSTTGWKIEESFLEAVDQLEKPKTFKKLQSLLGFANWQRPFIHMFADICAPLYEILKSKNMSEWGERQDEALEILKQKFRSKTILIHPDINKVFHLFSDASKFAIGGVLLQQGDKDQVGRYRPVGYFSKRLNQNEKNYGIAERECLALVRAVEFFKPIIIASEVIGHVDQKSATWLLQNSDNSMFVRCRESLQDINIKLEYVEGKKNGAADYMSRHFEEVPEDEIEIDIGLVQEAQMLEFIVPEEVYAAENGILYVKDKIWIPEALFETLKHQLRNQPSELIQNIQEKFSTITGKDWQHKQEKCTLCLGNKKNKKLINALEISKENKNFDELKDDKLFMLYKKTKEEKRDCFSLKGQTFHVNQFEEIDNKLKFLGRWVISQSQGIHLLREIHKSHRTLSHSSFTNLYETVRNIYFWQGLRRDCDTVIKECELCTKQKKKARNINPGTLVKNIQVLSSIHIDIYGSKALSKTNGCEVILGIVDETSRFVRFVPQKNKSWEETKKNLETRWFAIFGRPDFLRCDGNILSKDGKEWLQSIGIKVSLSGAYEARQNGLIERAIGIFGKEFELLLNDEERKGLKWTEACYEAGERMNHLKRKILNDLTPFEFLFRRKEKVLKEHLLKSPQDIKLDEEEIAERIYNIREKIVESKQKNEKMFEKFVPGDVIIWKPGRGISKMKKNEKFAEVIETVGKHNLWIKTEDGRKRFVSIQSCNLLFSQQLKGGDVNGKP